MDGVIDEWVIDWIAYPMSERGRDGARRLARAAQAAAGRVKQWRVIGGWVVDWIG